MCEAIRRLNPAIPEEAREELPDARAEPGTGYLVMVSGEGGRTVSRTARVNLRGPARILAMALVAPNLLTLRFGSLDGSNIPNASSFRVETTGELAGERTAWRRVAVPFQWVEGAWQCELVVDEFRPAQFYRLVEP